jgi:ATP-dependent DNA helicase RecG
MSFDLNYYLKPISELGVVGKKREAFYKRLVGNRYVDLLWHLPNSLSFRQHVQSIFEASENSLVTLEVDVEMHHPNLRKRTPYRIFVRDLKNNRFELVFFNAYSSFLQRAAPEGKRIAVSGQLKRDKLSDTIKFQMSHPDFMGPVAEIDKWVGAERVYSLTAGITRGMLVQAVENVLKDAYEIPEWHADENMPSFLKALQLVHHPKTHEQLGVRDPARTRLIMDEYLAYHLGFILSMRKNTAITDAGNSFEPNLANQLIELLPFQLTTAQQKVIAEIRCDMQKSHQMVRLLQGDVGSGKTLVAVIAALDAVDMGAQAAILVPTEILARQHMAKIQQFVETLGLKVVLLIGREKGKTREQILGEIKNGAAHIIVGTHALLENQVEFKNLNLVVIDEQHRFGVEQRMRLSQKANAPHILSMTATPIPRTLMLASHGDMDVSVLDEKPSGRKIIQTKVLNVDRIEEVIEQLKSVINQGRQIYWVCPLIEESENSDFAAAVARFENLKMVFNDQVELVHGKLKGPEKDASMQRFASGEAKILVATTVIEVGVDVPNATIMVIEHAQRFGLAQLHQLRGRVGRSDLQSYCLLLYGQPLTFHARKRLETMRDCHDGFKIAEEDLKLRGGGEIIGLKQSGIPKFRFSDLVQDDPNEALFLEELFAKAHNMAKEIAATDPLLRSPKGLALRQLLVLFEKDNAELLRKSG